MHKYMDLLQNVGKKKKNLNGSIQNIWLNPNL